MSSVVTLEQALHMEYRFDVTVQAEGGFVIRFPDLPGCMTQVANITEVSVAAEEIRTLWLETANELGQDLPAPVYPEEFNCYEQEQDISGTTTDQKHAIRANPGMLRKHKWR